MKLEVRAVFITALVADVEHVESYLPDEIPSYYHLDTPDCWGVYERLDNGELRHIADRPTREAANSFAFAGGD